MDKLATQLREDAERINATVSDELDHRIVASLRAVTPVAERKPAPADEQPVATPAPMAAVQPPIELNMETAMLTAPLQEELEALQSDLKKAEEKVRRDIGL